MAFCYILYKKFLPSIGDSIGTFIKKTQEDRYRILGKLHSYQKEYEIKQKKLEKITQRITDLQQKAIQLEHNLSIKIKTLKFNEDVKRTQNQKNLMDFYKKKHIKNWLLDNKAMVIETIKNQSKPSSPLPPLDAPKKSKTSQKKPLDKSVLDAIDQW
jgi:glucan phosphoethanolaminetransferase (alkaline phosphatase superfamily)